MVVIETIDEFAQEVVDHDGGGVVKHGQMERERIREGLYRALSSSVNPEFSTVLRVIKALKIKLHATPATPPKPRRAPRKKSGDLAAA